MLFNSHSRSRCFCPFYAVYFCILLGSFPALVACHFPTVLSLFITGAFHRLTSQIHVCSSSVYQRFSWSLSLEFNPCSSPVYQGFSRLPYWELIPLFSPCLSGEITFLWDAVLPLLSASFFRVGLLEFYPFYAVRACTISCCFIGRLLHRSARISFLTMRSACFIGPLIHRSVDS